MIAFMPSVPLVEATGSWDIEKAAREVKPGNLFPSAIAGNGLQGNREVAAVLEGKAVAGYFATPVEIVSVPKLGGATRPAADVSIEDQVVFSALSNAILGRLHAGMVTFTRADITYDAFEKFPVEFPMDSNWEPHYVVMADAVSFYEYVEHDRLERELVGLTGLAGVAEGLIDLLEVWMNSTRGLPQGPEASDLIADIYIAPVSRTLMRAGFDHSRYSDDFRVPVASWRDARTVQELLESALRGVGLVLSVPKLRTPTIERYLTYLDLIPELEEVDPNDLAWLGGDYSGEDAVAEPPSEEEVAKAVETFSGAISVLGPDLVDSRRMRRCLPWLGAAGEPLPLALAGEFLDQYAHLTPEFSAYVEQFMETEHEPLAVANIVNWLQQPVFKYPWQVGWLFHALSAAAGNFPALVETALAVLYDDTVPWFARGQAALLCASQHRLPAQRRFVDVYERSPMATRPDLVGSVVIQQPIWASSFLTAAATTPILRAVAEFDPDLYRLWV
jgi:hypothetical protein